MSSHIQIMSDLEGESTAVQIRTVTSRGGVVLLCCHSQDRVDLDLVANRLHSRGCLVEVVGSIDMDSGALSSAMGHHEESAWYIFCRTPKFGTRQIIKYRQFLLSHGVKERQVQTLDFDAENPNELIENIIETLTGENDKHAKKSVVNPVLWLKKAASNVIKTHRLLAGGIAAGLLLAGFAAVFFNSDENDNLPPLREPGIQALKVDAKGQGFPTKNALARIHSESSLQARTQKIEKLPSAPSATEPPKPRSIDVLIKNRKIRSIDNILVLKNKSKKMCFEEARDYCRDLSIDSVAGWRLPSLGELRSISIARLVNGNAIWSHTPADIFGESYFIWNPLKQSTEVRAVTWKKGFVVCVRLHTD